MMRIAKRAVLLTLLMAGCNLTTAPPTPTPPPTEFIPTVEGPVLFPTISTPINPDCPATPPTWIAYTVEPGDTLSLLAEQTSSTVEELVAGNCMDNVDQIFVDTLIYLPRTPVISP
jgi:hypothetical protein